MPLRRILLAASAVLALVLPSSGDLLAPPRGPLNELPVGQWSVEFANGVRETCAIKRDGTASVAEPRRTSTGKVTVKEGAFLIACEDDRLERWTPVGKRMVVEHWFPGSQLPVVTPVLGIAERVP